MANFLSDALDIGNTDLYDKAKENKHDQVESLQFSKHKGTESEPKSFTNIPYDKIGIIDSAIDDKESISRIPGSLSIEEYDKRYDELDSIKRLNRVEGKESEPSTLLLGKLQSIDEFYANANKNTPEKKAAFIKSIEEFYKQQTGYPVVPIQVTKTIDEFYDENIGKFKELLPYEYVESLSKQMEDIMMSIKFDVNYDEKKIFEEVSSRYNSMISEMQTAGVLSPETIEKFRIGSDDVRNESLALIHKYTEALHEFTNVISDNNEKGEFNNIQTDGNSSVGPDFDKYSSEESKLNTKSSAANATDFSNINNDGKTTLPPNFNKYSSAETKLNTKSALDEATEFSNINHDDKNTLPPDFDKYTTDQVKLDGDSKFVDSTVKSFADIDDISDKEIKHGEVPDSIETEYDNKSVMRRPLPSNPIDVPANDLNKLVENDYKTDRLKDYEGRNSYLTTESADTKESTFLKKVADINTTKGMKEDREVYDSTVVPPEKVSQPLSIYTLKNKMLDIRNSVASNLSDSPFIKFLEMYMGFQIANEVRYLRDRKNGEYYNDKKVDYENEFNDSSIDLAFDYNNPEKFKKTFWYYYSKVNMTSAVAFISSTTDRLLDKLKENTGADIPGWANGKNVSNSINTVKQMGIVPDGLRKAENMLEDWLSAADIVAKLYQNKDKLTFENLTFAATYMYFETPLLPHIDVHTSEVDKFGYNTYNILGYDVQTGFLNGLKKYGKNLAKGVTGLFGIDPFNDSNENKGSGEDKGWGAEHFIATLYNAYYKDNNYDKLSIDKDRAEDFIDKEHEKGYVRTQVMYHRQSSDNKDDNNVGQKIFNIYTFKPLSGKNEAENIKSDGTKETSSYEAVKGEESGVTISKLQEIQVSELANELVFKGRESIRNYTLFDQFKWDLKLERIEGVTNGSADTNEESSKYRVPLLSEFLNEGNAVSNNGNTWLPVSDFNINFSDMDMATIPLFQGMNLPMPEKLSFPLSGSITFLENANLAVTSWLHAYKRTIFAGTGGYLTMPYQRCALKLSIYFWEWISSKKSLRLLESMVPYTLSKDTREFIKKYVLYILPTNIPDNIVGSSSPSPLSVTMNFSIVGAESGYMVDLNEAKRLYTTESKTTERSVGKDEYVKQKIQMKNASSNNINASLYQPGVDKAAREEAERQRKQEEADKAAIIEANKAKEIDAINRNGGRAPTR